MPLGLQTMVVQTFRTDTVIRLSYSNRRYKDHELLVKTIWALD